PSLPSFPTLRSSDLTPAWMAKLDTVVHELYHIDPAHNGIRRIDRPDGSCSRSCHGPQFFSEVARMVEQYLDSQPDAGAVEFLKRSEEHTSELQSRVD